MTDNLYFLNKISKNDMLKLSVKPMPMVLSILFRLGYNTNATKIIVGYYWWCLFLNTNIYVLQSFKIFISKTKGTDVTVTVTGLCEGIWNEQYDTAATVDLCPDQDSEIWKRQERGFRCYF